MSYSGLNSTQAREARHLCLRMTERLMSSPSLVHYTQGPGRWDGITHHKGIQTSGFFPYYGDCSSTTTHILWRALHVGFALADHVNGADWKAGYTGTQIRHGYRIRMSHLKVADLVFYGGGGGVPGHVAMAVGNGKVFSHGSEGGPYILPVRYRSDIWSYAKRYI